MKNSRLLTLSLLSCVLAYSLAVGAWRAPVTEGTPLAAGIYNAAGETASARFTRNDSAIDFSGVPFEPWDVAAASEGVEKRAKKPYTIMLYMNGSDLESEDGAATDDLIEMLDSGLLSGYANLVLFTGGTNRWQNDVVPENECALWEIRDGMIYKLGGVGLVNMGNAGTLASFIDFSVKRFPADKYGLIMWDHGGGSIAGYGHDENFNNSNLTLLDMNCAFKRSELSKKKLEFLGFDSCLMATTEMAVIASDYAEYLIASEDLEPGDGWDYSFLSALNDNPAMSGAELGKIIADSFMQYYGPRSGEVLTLSVTDLSKAKALAGAVDGLMRRCSDSLAADSAAAFNTLSRKRNGTKTFGEGSPRDNDCDMVDVGDMAQKLSDLYPNEAANVLRALEECVVYNRHNSNADLKGLSLYYIYGGKANGREALSLYGALKTNGEHTRYLDSFFAMLTEPSLRQRSRSRNALSSQSAAYDREDIVSAKLTLWKRLENSPDTLVMCGERGTSDIEPYAALASSALWPEINGYSVCLHHINSTSEGSLYAIPATVNGRDCDVVVRLGEDYGGGKIMGVRYEDGLIIQKGFDKIKDGDVISFYNETRRENGFSDPGVKSFWYLTPGFAVDGGLRLDWASAPSDGSRYISYLLTDVGNNEYFTEPLPYTGALIIQ